LHKRSDALECAACLEKQREQRKRVSHASECSKTVHAPAIDEKCFWALFFTFDLIDIFE
jgi:hypothetical protein